jgi:GDP-mannose 6-dehydrogenase
MLGLSFKAATDDLRESPHVELVKRLIGEGKHLRIWDDTVSLGRLLGSNRQYIEQSIPHIGSLLSGDLGEVVQRSGLIVIGSRSIRREAIERHLRDDHVIVDLVNLEKERRSAHLHYKGICW